MIASDSLKLRVKRISACPIEHVHPSSISPNYEIIVVVVNECGDTIIRIVPGELRSLLFVLVEVEKNGLVGEVKLIQDISDLPIHRALLTSSETLSQAWI